MKVLLYSYYQVAPEEVARIRGFAAKEGFEIVDSSVPPPPKDGVVPVNPVKLDELVGKAVEDEAEVVVVLSPDSLPPKPEKLLKLLLDPLVAAKKRFRALSEPLFDTEAPGFLYGFRWALDARARGISERTKDWHEKMKEDGVHTGRPVGKKNKHPPCVNCHHRVVKPGRPGHVLVGGSVGPCYSTGCGCSRYSPSSPILTG